MPASSSKIAPGPLSRTTSSLHRKKQARAWRAALQQLLDEPGSSRAAVCVFCVIIAAIIASVSAFFLSSVKSITAPDGGHAIWVVEACCVSIFTVEVGFRTLVATMDLKQLMLLDPYFWIDVLAIIPFYIDQLFTLPPGLRWMQLLRLLRILKLLRHYLDMRVLMLALGSAWRALVIPGFAMLLCSLILSGALWIAEGQVEDEALAFEDAFEALWCVFWIVTTLGYEGRFGTGGAIGQCIIALAIICGVILTTMPITFIGEAFSSAWHRRELLLLEMRVQDELMRRGISVHDFRVLFDELDEDGSGELDWSEYKAALQRLSIRLPVNKMREVFESLDEDKQGTVSYEEMCKKLFPKQDWKQIEEDRIAQIVRVQALVRGFLSRTSKGKACGKAGTVTVIPSVATRSRSKDVGDWEETTLQSPRYEADGTPPHGVGETRTAPTTATADATRMEALEKAVQTLNAKVDRLLEVVCKAPTA